MLHWKGIRYIETRYGGKDVALRPDAKLGIQC